MRTIFFILSFIMLFGCKSNSINDTNQNSEEQTETNSDHAGVKNGYEKSWRRDSLFFNLDSNHVIVSVSGGYIKPKIIYQTERWKYFKSLPDSILYYATKTAGAREGYMILQSDSDFWVIANDSLLLMDIIQYNYSEDYIEELKRQNPKMLLKNRLRLHDWLDEDGEESWGIYLSYLSPKDTIVFRGMEWSDGRIGFGPEDAIIRSNHFSFADIGVGLKLKDVLDRYGFASFYKSIKDNVRRIIIQAPNKIMDRPVDNRYDRFRYSRFLCPGIELDISADTVDCIRFGYFGKYVYSDDELQGNIKKAIRQGYDYVSADTINVFEEI